MRNCELWDQYNLQTNVPFLAGFILFLKMLFLLAEYKTFCHKKIILKGAKCYRPNIIENRTENY